MNHLTSTLWNGVWFMLLCAQTVDSEVCNQFECGAPTPLTVADKLAWLNDHNQVRCQANAQTMPALIWDEALEKTAQEWANTCPQGHNEPAGAGTGRVARFNFFSGMNVRGVGENYAAGQSDYIACDNDWASEKPQMGGHYTQMVWAGTTRVGCAKNTVACSGLGYYYICDYYPPGNYVGQKPFVAGSGTTNTEACQQQNHAGDLPTYTYTTGGTGSVVNVPVTGGGGGGAVTPTNPPPTDAPANPSTNQPATTPSPNPATNAPTNRPATPSPATNAPNITPAPNPTPAPNGTPVPTAPPSSTTTTPASGTTRTPTAAGPTDPNTGGALSGTPQPAGLSNTQTSGGSGLNTGLIAGVVIGMVIGVVVIAIAVYFVYRHYSHSTSWSTSKTHIEQFHVDPNRFQGNTQPPTGPQPLTSISTTTPAATPYNPGNVFNPPSFAAHGGAATTGGIHGNWSHHQKHESMDNYQANPALAAAAQATPPIIPTSRPQMPAPTPPVVPTSRPHMPVPTPPTRPPTGQFGGQAIPAGGVTPFPSQPRPW